MASEIGGLCEEYAIGNDIISSGNKSEYLILKEEVVLLQIAMLMLMVPAFWNVEQATHLGHCLSTTNDPDSLCWWG